MWYMEGDMVLKGWTSVHQEVKMGFGCRWRSGLGTVHYAWKLGTGCGQMRPLFIFSWYHLAKAGKAIKCEKKMSKIHESPATFKVRCLIITLELVDCQSPRLFYCLPFHLQICIISSFLLPISHRCNCFFFNFLSAHWVLADSHRAAWCTCWGNQCFLTLNFSV